MFLSWCFSTRLKIKYEMYITTRLLLSSHPSEGIPSILGGPHVTYGMLCPWFMDQDLLVRFYLSQSYCDDSKCQKWHIRNGPVINRITSGKYLIQSLQNFGSSIFETLISGIFSSHKDHTLLLGRLVSYSFSISDNFTDFLLIVKLIVGQNFELWKKFVFKF